MATCDECGRQENMPYSCRYCGGSFCADHRLPENHSCPGLEDWNDPGGVFDSGFDDSIGGSAGGGSIADRIGINTGAGGILGYFRGNLSFLFLALMWVTFFLQLFIGEFASRRLVTDLFALTTENPEYVWTWITSIFAHGGFGHIAVNSIVLYFFGPIVERRVGARKFALLFFSAGIIAGLSQVGTAILLNEGAAVVGASGAIMAIMGVLTVLNPGLKVYLYFILPVPLWLLTIGFAGYSVFIAVGGGIGAGGTAHLAHLAGLVIGLGYGEKLRREGAKAPQQLQFGGRRGGPGGRRRF